MTINLHGDGTWHASPPSNATAEAALRGTLDLVAECEAELVEAEPMTVDYERALGSYAEALDGALDQALALLGITRSPDPREEPA